MFAIHISIVFFFIRRSDPTFCYSLIHPNTNDHDSNHVSSLAGTVLHDYFCGSEGHRHESGPGEGLSDSLLLLIIHPIIQSILFPGVNVYVIWLQSCSSIIVFLSILFSNGQKPPASILLVWIVINISIPLSHHRKNIRMFSMHQQLEERSQQDAKEQEEQHLTEMRFVIANVAHDLKTVSQKQNI
jgi:hypothetical protein